MGSDRRIEQLCGGQRWMSGSEPLRHHEDPWLASFEAAGALEHALATDRSIEEVAGLASRVILSALDAFALLLRADGHVIGASSAYLRAAGTEQSEVSGREVWRLPAWP